MNSKINKIIAFAILLTINILLPWVTGGLFAQTFNWAQSISATGNQEYFCVANDSLGNKYAAGYFENTVVLDVQNTIISNGGKDMVIIKYNSQNTIAWVQNYGSIGTDELRGIKLDNSGNVYVSGTYGGTFSFGSLSVPTTVGSQDDFVAKLDGNGTPLWFKTFGSGGFDECRGLDINRTNNDVYIVANTNGAFTVDGFAVGNIGAQDFVTIKFNSNGVTQWATSSGSTSVDNIGGVAVSLNGDAYITGSFVGSMTLGTIALQGVPFVSTCDMFTAKIFNNGTYDWAKRGGGALNDKGLAISFINDPNNSTVGNAYVTGSFIGTGYFDSSTLNSAGGEDAFLVKYTSASVFSFARSLGSASDDKGTAVIADFNNVYVCGSFGNTVTVANSTLTAVGNIDCFLAKVEIVNGNWQWATSFGSTNLDYVNSISTKNFINFYLAGTYYDTLVFNPALNLTHSSGSDGYITQLDINPDSIPICMVTVDTLSLHNIVYWEQPTATNIDSIRIFRETATNIFTHIASVSPDSLSKYIDTALSADPNVTYHRYSIAVLDNSGNQSLLSSPHKTINLQINTGINAYNLSWNDYLGNPVNFYRVWRDSLGNGVWTLISNTIPAGGGTITYNDNNPPLGTNVNYYVEVDWNTSCDITKDFNTLINRSRSNIKLPASILPSFVNEIDNFGSEIHYLQNNGTIRIETKNNNPKTIFVFDILGKKLIESNFETGFNLDSNNLTYGFYTIQIINSNKQSAFHKIVIQK